MQVVRYY
jgi:hypothetical protein